MSYTYDRYLAHQNKDLYQGHRRQKSCTSKSLSVVELASVGRGGASAQSDKKDLSLNF